MRGRPHLHTDYESEQAILPTMTQKVTLAVVLTFAVLLPLHAVPGLRFIGDGDWLTLVNRALVFAVAALGLNLLTGVAGQVSLGHAFFMAVGAYTAVVLGGQAGTTTWGLGLPMWIWLPAGGVVAALVGVLVAPTAVRVRGLYLAIVTLGLVFLGLHLWRNLGNVAGGATTGRDWPRIEFSLWRGEEPLLDLSSGGTWFGVFMRGEAKTYYFLLVVLIGFTLLSKNLMRTRTGRAFAAIRDRDIAAEIMGVGDTGTKLRAFAISSFYAGVGGALLGAVAGRLIPETWNLLLSVEFVAIILIGGAGTLAGPLIGSFFVVLLPRLVEDFTHYLTAQAATGEGVVSWLADLVIAGGGGDFGFISTQAAGPGLSVFQMNQVIFGALIILFLIFEPLGLYGIWIRVRNYWKGWPFTY